jgi:hypothetical protein
LAVLVEERGNRWSVSTGNQWCSIRRFGLRSLCSRAEEDRLLFN